MGSNPSLVTVLTAWSFEPSIVVGVALAAWVYCAGLQELARRGRLGRSIRARHVAYFALGLVCVLIALVSPVDTLSVRLLSIHMVQHVLLLLIAPPLLLLGKPVPVLLVGAPRSLVRAIARAHARRAWFRGFTGLLLNPFFAWPLYIGTAFAWHLPALYDAALRNSGVHVLEHLCYLATGLVFWAVVIQPFPSARRLAPGWRLAFVLAAMLPDAILGLAFILIGTPIYPFYAAEARLWGISVLDDQALAGNIMFVGGDFIFACAVIPLFAAAMNQLEERELARWSALDTE